MRSRPDRQPDVMERRARGEEAQRARDAHVATPAFTLVTDEDASTHESAAAPSSPHLRAKPSPRATTVNKYWFNPSWVAENERPDVEHGEFQSPVWLAVEMTMRADREREMYEFGAPRLARHAAEERGTGQLRSLLAFVSGAKNVGASQHTPVTCNHQGAAVYTPCAATRYHDVAPRPARHIRRFVRFISSSLERVSVNQN